MLCITWWFPVSERDILGVLVHKIYFLPYVYGESGYNVGWLSMCTVLCGGPPSFHCIRLVLCITVLLFVVSCVVCVVLILKAVRFSLWGVELKKPNKQKKLHLGIL